MKEIVFIATVFMEFNDEAVCNAFYKNFNSTDRHNPTCTMVIRYKDLSNLSYGSLDDIHPRPKKRPNLYPQPMSRPEGMFK